MASLQQTVPGTTDLDGSGNPVTAGAFYADLEASSAVVLWDRLNNSTLGTVTGTTTYAAGRFGRQAFSFDGATHIDLAGDARTAQGAADAMTVAVRFRASTVDTSRGAFLNLSTNVLWALYSNGNCTGSFQGVAGIFNGAATGLGLLDDAWHSLVLVAETSPAAGADTLRVYVDGALRDTQTGDAGPYIASTTSTSRLGRFFNLAADRDYFGLLQDYAVLDSAWGAGEQSAYHAGPAPTITANSLAFAAGVLTATVAATSNNGAVSNYVILQYRPNDSTPWVTVQEGATLTYTPTLSGEYSHVYAPSNDAGIAAPVRSNVVSVTLDSPRFVTPLITPLLVPMGA